VHAARDGKGAIRSTLEEPVCCSTTLSAAQRGSGAGIGLEATRLVVLIRRRQFEHERHRTVLLTSEPLHIGTETAGLDPQTRAGKEVANASPRVGDIGAPREPSSDARRESSRVACFRA